MRLAEAVYRGITRGRSPLTEGGTVRSMVAELEQAYGATPPPGIAGRTWRRARHDPGWNPIARVRAALRAAQRAARLGLGREAFLRSSPPCGFYGRVRISKDTRDRKVIVSTWPSWSPAHADRIVDAYLARDDQAAADVLLSTFLAEVPEWEILDTYQVRWFRTADEAAAWQRVVPRR